MKEVTNAVVQAAVADEARKAVDQLLVGVPEAVRYWDEVLLWLDPARAAESSADADAEAFGQK